MRAIFGKSADRCRNVSTDILKTEQNASFGEKRGFGMSSVEQYVSHFARPNSHQLHGDGTTFRRNILLLNSDVISGAPYFTITWYCSAGDPKTDTHVHDFDEYIGFAGSDPTNPEDLGGIVRFMIDDEWVTLDKSTILFIPAGVKHCPYEIVHVDRPIIHWSGGNSSIYQQIR